MPGEQFSHTERVYLIDLIANRGLSEDEAVREMQAASTRSRWAKRSDRTIRRYVAAIQIAQSPYADRPRESPIWDRFQRKAGSETGYWDLLSTFRAVRSTRNQESSRRHWALENHYNQMMAVVSQIRECLYNPQIDVHAILGTGRYQGESGPLYLAGHDWTLESDTWVQLATPDFSEEKLWDKALPYLKTHMAKSPFWEGLDSLRREANDFAHLVNGTLEAQMKKHTELADHWQQASARAGFKVNFQRTPRTPIPDVVGHLSDAAVRYFVKLLAEEEPRILEVPWDLLRGLQRLNDELEEDVVVSLIQSSKCPFCDDL